MSKMCIKCGAELEDDAVFCDECGTRLASAPRENADEQLNQIKPDSAEPKKKQSVMGIVSLCMGIIGFLTLGTLYLPEILGIILGILGRRDKTAKSGFATAGLILSLLAAAMWLL